MPIQRSDEDSERLSSLEHWARSPSSRSSHGARMSMLDQLNRHGQLRAEGRIDLALLEVVDWGARLDVAGIVEVLIRRETGRALNISRNRPQRWRPELCPLAADHLNSTRRDPPL